MNLQIEVRNCVFEVVDSLEHQWFWPQVNAGDWEPETFCALDKIPDGALYIDIGTWIGPTVLYAANKAGRVIGVEPDPVALSQLLKNLAQNPALALKVEIWNAALANERRLIDLHSANLGNSMSSVLDTRGSAAMKMQTLDVNDFLEKVIVNENYCFVKCDVEGAEFDLVPALIKSLNERDIDFDLYVAFHGHFFEGTGSVVDWTENLYRNVKLLALLARQGEILSFNGNDFVQITTPAFQELRDFGRLSTNIFVRSRSKT